MIGNVVWVSELVMEWLNVVDIIPGSLENERISEQWSSEIELNWMSQASRFVRYCNEQFNLHCLMMMMMMMMMVTPALQAGLQVIPEVLNYDKDVLCSSYLQLMINHKWRYVELLTEFHQFQESCLRWWWWCRSIVHSDELERVASDVKVSAWVSQQAHIVGNSFKIH